jgi:hypothetical protein
MTTTIIILILIYYFGFRGISKSITDEINKKKVIDVLNDLVEELYIKFISLHYIIK